MEELYKLKWEKVRAFRCTMTQAPFRPALTWTFALLIGFGVFGELCLIVAALCVTVSWLGGIGELIVWTSINVGAVLFLRRWTCLFRSSALKCFVCCLGWTSVDFVSLKLIGKLEWIYVVPCKLWRPAYCLHMCFEFIGVVALRIFGCYCATLSNSKSPNVFIIVVFLLRVLGLTVFESVSDSSFYNGLCF